MLMLMNRVRSIESLYTYPQYLVAFRFTQFFDSENSFYIVSYEVGLLKFKKDDLHS
jgi:hypothetical protein